jgi:hypothetical protein
VVGRSFVWDWWNVEVVTSMKRDEPNLVCLSCRNEARQSRSLTVWIEWTPCNYGGARAWFICPRGCGRRVAVLYNRGHFACRHCHQLAYESQQESRKYRELHRAQEIRMKLGRSASLVDPFPAKPKRMHWRTYQRLYAKAMATEEGFLGCMAGCLSRLAQRSDRGLSITLSEPRARGRPWVTPEQQEF